jgi:signal transduction histidine kinase
LLSVLLVLMGCVLLSLGLPLGRSMADRQQQDLFLDRLGDTSRFASLAGQAVEPADLDLLREDLRRYDQLHGVTVAVIGLDGAVLVASREKARINEDQLRTRARTANTGRRSEAPPSFWPWDGRPMVVAEPVYRAGEVISVAVTSSPTGGLRATVLRQWTGIAAGSLVVVALFVLAAFRLTSWMLRPVGRLDLATQAITGGALDARVNSDTGPPELRRLASAFNEMAGAVAAAIEQQRTFIANASHQLRNPLGALLLRVEQAAMGAPPSAVKELAEAQEEGRRLTAVLDDLLTVARLENCPVQLRRLDALALLAGRVRSWRVVADRRGITLCLDGLVGAWVLADPLTLGGCVDALLDNALKFSDEGSTVLVGVREVPGSLPPMVDLMVIDEGPGLSDEEIAQVGERFWRGAGHQNVTGSGLGLSIVQASMRAQGGKLHVESRSPQGLLVAVRLPQG